MCKIAKFFVLILKELTVNECCVEDFFDLLKKFFNKIQIYLWQALTLLLMKPETFI